MRLLFNRWKPYPKHKPKKRDEYLCFIRYGEQPDEVYVMILTYLPELDRWKNFPLQHIFNIYDVYGYNDETGKNDKRLYTDRLVYRDDVIAFKKLPKIFIIKGWIYYEKK